MRIQRGIQPARFARVTLRAGQLRRVGTRIDARGLECEQARRRQADVRLRQAGIEPHHRLEGLPRGGEVLAIEGFERRAAVGKRPEGVEQGVNRAGLFPRRKQQEPVQPLDGITNTRRIFKVYWRGKELDRQALKARFMTGVAKK